MLVKNINSSICGTQMGEWLGKRNNTSMMPNCFGHEGVSKVIEIGKNVKKLKKDDIVCVSWIKKNNKDSGGIKIKNAKKIINAGPVNNFSDYSLISQNRLYKIKKNQGIKLQELLKTFENLGISLKEQERLSGVAVDAVIDSISIGTTFKEKLGELGIIFCSFSEAVEEHPELIKKYLGMVVPKNDNYFAALNSAVFSDGSFCYIPKGVRCPMELSTYF